MEKVKGTFTKQDIQKIRVNLRDRCAYCNEPLKGKGCADHIISIFNGGSNFARNITLACRWCNLNKRTKSASGFLQWRKICGLKNRRGVSNGRKI
jgi:5-methylcytosine-specific restriction endonuclease McrA